MSRVRLLSVRRRWAIVLALTAASFVVAQRASAVPDGLPSTTTARSELDALVVSPEGSGAGYSRDLFPHWITVSGTCNTRETVLRRDGSGVDVDGSCRPTSGSWLSEYDGVTVTTASSVDIDHVVPLAEGAKHAWGLHRQSTEKAALQGMLSTCST